MTRSRPALSIAPLVLLALPHLAHADGVDTPPATTALPPVRIASPAAISAQNRWTWGRPDGHVALAGILATATNLAVSGVCLSLRAQCAWTALPAVGPFVSMVGERDAGARAILAVDGALRVALPALFVLTMLRMPGAHEARRAAGVDRRPHMAWIPFGSRQTAGFSLSVTNF